MARLAWLDLDTWQEIWWSLTKNRLRTVLTAFGVFWGVLMLTLLLGFGQGLQTGVLRDFGGLLKNAMFVRPGTTLLPYAGLQPGRRLQFTNDDVRALSELPTVRFVSPQVRLGDWRDAQVVHRGPSSGSFTVSGTTPEFLMIDSVRLPRGRFLSSADLSENRKVAVLGKRASEVLFEDEDPIGQYVEFKGVHFQVIGEVKSERTGHNAERTDNSIFLPLTTFQRSFNRVNRVNNMAIALEPDADVNVVEQQLLTLLRQRHRVSPNDAEALRIFNVAEEFQRIKSLFDGIRIFVWFVGVLTLFAGILGVSNIILITIKERTKELGIRKALGATPASIVGLVITESLVLTCAAGYLGIAAGVGLLEAASRIVVNIEDAPLTEPSVDLRVVVIAAVVLVVGGLIAAIVPARHATSLHPVEALRAD